MKIFRFSRRYSQFKIAIVPMFVFSRNPEVVPDFFVYFPLFWLGVRAGGIFQAGHAEFRRFGGGRTVLPMSKTGSTLSLARGGSEDIRIC